MCRKLIQSGWTLNDIEDAEFDTLIAVVCAKKEEQQQKIDLMDYMKQDN